MEHLLVRSSHPAYLGAVWLQRLLALVCAGVYCATPSVASEIHGNETGYPTVMYTDTDVPSTGVPRLRNLRISTPFRLGSGAVVPLQPPPPAEREHASALPRGDDPQRAQCSLAKRSRTLPSTLLWILTMATTSAILGIAFFMMPARQDENSNNRRPPRWDPLSQHAWAIGPAKLYF